jgi:fumarate reductase iron-sulfur subunit
MTAATWRVEVWRSDAGGGWQGFDLPRRARQTVLDLVSEIQRGPAPDLAYRFACRVGMCGSCAMTVNDRPRWTCRTRVETVAERGEIRVGPLQNLPVVRDLVTDMAPMFDKWAAAGGHFQGDPAARDFAVVAPAEPMRAAADAAIECIGCGVCHSACDTVAWNPDYLGPAALNRAWTLVNDTRDRDRDGRLAAVAGDAGCHACHSHESCAAHCPKGLDPTASIAGLKRMTLARRFGL